MDRAPPPPRAGSPGKPRDASPSPARAPPPPPPPASGDAAADASPPSGAPPPPPPGPPPPPASQNKAPSRVNVPQAAAPPISAPSPVSPGAGAPVTGGSPGTSHMTPHSKLLNHLPLDCPDEMDRKWYAHFYHMQKAIQGKDETAALAILKQAPSDTATPPLQFQPDVALLYAIITEPPLSKLYLRYLTAIAAGDNYKNVVGWLQRLIELKFVKLLVSCRSQLLWLVRELVHLNVPGVEKVIMSLMRYLTGGDPSRTTVWLASSIIRILIEHEAWLLSSASLIPFVFHTFVRISLDHTAPQHASLLKQEVELCTLLWNRRQSDVAQLGREVVRILNDAKDVPGMNLLWKQLRNVRDTDPDSDKDPGIFSVAQLMATTTPPKYLAYRLSPKMEEELIFMMERVQVGAVTRYQKWFSSQFLSAPGSDSLVPDLVRYICAVYHPSNQILGSKVTPRYHLLGWLYLLCHGSKTPSVLARVQLAMFFDFLYFKPTDNIMSVEPPILLMVKSLKSHPMVTLAMIQFLVFAVEKFAASPVNNQLKQKGVSTAFAMTLKVGVVSSIAPLQSFPLLQSSAPELTSELHRIFPEHFPTADGSQPHPQPTGHVSPGVGATSPSRSPGLTSPVHPSAGESPVRGSPVRESPVRGSPARGSPARGSPARGSPVGAGSPLTSPLRSPTHSDASTASGATSTDSLGALSFLPGNQQAAEPTEAAVADSSDVVAGPAITAKHPIDPPALVLELGEDDIKQFQEMMPEPCSRPTEGFLECLNDILISWIRHDKAVEIAAPLGEFVHSSLDRIILSSRISVTDSPKVTCGGIFDSILDQVISEPKELFVPFLRAMMERDVTISFRLLTFCCSRSIEKSPDTALAPYAAFVEGMGNNVTQSIMKDLALAQQVDDARAHACAALEKTMPSNGPSDEMDAVSAVVLVVAPYLFAHMDHAQLSKLAGRSESLVQLVLGLSTPATLNDLCTRVTLGDFVVFRDRLANTLLSSLQWSSWEQYALWDLVVAEVQSSYRSSSASEAQFMTAARKVLACVNPKENTETMLGLLKCLPLFHPESSILQSVWKLSDAYGDFPLATLACWIERFPETVAGDVRSRLGKAGDSDLTDPLTVAMLGKLDRLQARRRLQRTVGSVTQSSDSDLALLQNVPVADALRRVLEHGDRARAKSEWPSLVAALLSEDEPPAKKQRIGDDA